VVAGEDAETAGVLRQGGGDAELGREVADRPGCAVRHRLLVPARLREIGVQVFRQVRGAGNELPVGGELLQARRLDLAEEADGVVSA